MPVTPNDIEKEKQKAIDALNSHIDEMGNAAYTILLAAIEDTFDFKAGKIEAGKDFIKQLNKLTVDVLNLLQSEPKFTGPISQFIKRLPVISDQITELQKDLNGIQVPAFEVAKNTVIDEILNQMLNNGLNQHFVIPLRDLIYRNVSSGLSLKDARQQIKDFIKGGKDQSGKLGRYIDQTAIQAVDAYSGAINQKILQNFEMNGLLMTGSLIDTSSPQCKYGINELKGKITRQNFEDLKSIAENHGLIQGTNFDNLPVNLLHWGCRHSFYPIIIKAA